MPSLPPAPDPRYDEEIRAYLKEGRLPGAFLIAVFSNDLRGAITHGDAFNHARLADWCAYCEDTLPLAAWGSAAMVRAWSTERGPLLQAVA